MSKSLEDILKICEEYTSDKKYVYKSCNNYPDRSREWLVIMEKCHDTITNEDRKCVINTDHAKFRADKLMVVKIININDGSMSSTKIVNAYLPSKSLEYKVGSVVECDEFNTDLDEVCGGGIHYFKTLITAYYYDDGEKRQQTYTGKWMEWRDDGQILRETDYSNGVLNGSSKTFYDNGKAWIEHKHKNGHKVGTWFGLYDDKGRKFSERRFSCEKFDY